MALPSYVRTLIVWVAPVLLAAGAGHLLFQIVKHWDIVTLDFRFFWLAGEFWSSGASPYSEDFTREAAERFGITKGAFWYYTPNWFFITALLSAADPLTASRFWLIANTILLLGASVLNVAAFHNVKASGALTDKASSFAFLLQSLPLWTVFALHAGFLGLTQAAGNTLHPGQSSMLIYFGASVLVFAATHKNFSAGAIGVAIIMLKPQIGLLLIPMLALSAYGRRVLVLGGLFSFLLAVPALLIDPTPDILSTLIASAAQYNDQHYNHAPAMTGLRHIVWMANGPELGPAFYMLTALLFICGVGLAGRKKSPRFNINDRLIAAVAITLLFAPLHVYDFTIIGVLLLYTAMLRPPAGALAMLGAAIIFRAGNLPQPVEAVDAAAVYYVGSLYATAGAGLIVIALMYAARFGVRLPVTARRESLSPS